MKPQGFIVLLILFFVYGLWFSFSGTLSSGDWPYLYLENIKEFSWSLDIRFLWLAPYYQILSKILVQYIGIPWEVVERLFWFWPFLLLAILSSYHLTKSWIGVLIYTTNTYILMVVAGGQMGVALAYSVAPLVLGNFINLINSFALDYHNFKFQISNFKFSIVAGLILAVQMMLDPRIAYVTIIAIVIYPLFNIRKVHISHLALHTLVIPIAITLTVNFYWIIPVLKHGLPEGVGTFGNLAGFEFLSFADFSHTFSLLHPNWPENIFGKTYFLQPEFLLLPILAYSSLLFLKTSKLQLKNEKLENNLTVERWSNQTILFFAALGLVGAFLAKGASEPFGFLNQWIFEYIPGMHMFRDPTKFYLLIALSYSVLIPFSISSIYSWLKSNIKYQKLNIQSKYQIFNFSYVFLIFTILFLIFLIRPALFGQLGGTFKTHQIPQEYITLKEFLKEDLRFSKTLWIPQKQRFGFSSKNHPALLAQELFNENDPLMISKRLSMKRSITFLRQQKVRYIIIPFDSQEELFLMDRKYSKSLRDRIGKDLDKLQNLVRKKSFGNITVYEIQ